MKLTHIVLTGAAMLFAVASHANTTNIGVISSAQTYSSGSATFAAGTPVNDLWTFDLSGGAYDAEIKLTQVFLAPANAISGFTATLSGGSLGSPVGIPLTTNTSHSQVLDLLQTLGAGSYQVAVSGLANVPAGSYTFQLGASPVPEPGAYLMLMSGVAVLTAFRARRR